ncbi:MAG: Omp28-related outer membrane protein [Chitinophagales bacterium]
MSKFFNIILIATIILLSAQCKEVETAVITDPSQLPLFDSTYVSSSNIAEVPKNVLMEEFSGVRCANCPAGTLKTKEISSNNPGRVTVMAIHSNFLAAPYDDSPDLRNDDAQEMALAPLGPIGGKPSTYINRTIFGSAVNIVVPDPNTWESFVNQELATTTPIDMKLESIFQDINERTVRYRITLNFAQQATGVNLGFALTESNIKAEQLDGSTKIKDYKHEHVLRSFIGSIYGETLTASIEANTVIIKEFEIDLDDEDFDPAIEWKMENMELVAFTRSSDQKIINSTHIEL